MNNDHNISKAKQLCYRYLSIKPRSEFEIRSKLSEKGFEKDCIDSTIENLKNYRYINDEDYTRIHVHYLANVKLYGRHHIVHTLKTKGIAKELVTPYLNNIDETTHIKTLIEKKFKNWHPPYSYQDRQKIGGFLSRRGFDWDLIKDFFNENK